MKRIILMRHGNAETSYQKSDFDRNLSDYGKKEVFKNVTQLMSNAIMPETVVVSKANRTLQSFNIFKDTLKYDSKFTIDEDLYNFYSTSEFLEKYIEKCDNNYNTVMFIGHNPTFSNLLQMLTGNLSIFMDTASVFVIDFDIENWNSLQVRTGKIFFSTH